MKHFGLVVLGLAALLSTRLSFAAEKRVSFEREIQPLLERGCNKCHHPDDSRGGLDLTRLSTMLRGGDELGPAVIANNPIQSPLIQVLTGKAEPAMPSNATPLPPAEIELLSRWIKQGAIDDTTKFSVADITFFKKYIRPVLFQSCFKCHAGDAPESGLSLTSRHGILTGGNRGPAAIAGDPKQSLLITAIRHQGDLKMPRGGDALSATQIDAFEKWIRLKLPWPSDSRVLTREKQFTISQADRDHWAFRPLPESLSKDWSIDQILDTKHQQHKLSAIEQADRYRLLRRLSYDLIGYPPTPAEITAFNNDRPYDWFARVHIAGDRMPGPDGANYSIDQALAAAVPLNGDRTFQNAATDTFVLMDKLDEGIEFMGRSLLGVSLECARCHDHKFDPISQRDYYALLGIFKSSWFGPVSSTASTINAADASLARYLELQREAARLRGLIRQAGTAINIGGGGLVRKWQASRQAPLAPKEKRGVELEVLILRSELQQAIADAASKSLINEMKKTIATREASLKNFRARHFYVVAFKELGYEIHGHKTQVGLIERATQVGLNLVTKELQQLDQFWIDERARWGERQTFGGYRKTDPEVAQMAAWHDSMQSVRTELAKMDGHQIMVRCEGGLRRSEELDVFEKQAKDDKRAFYPELVPAFIGDARLLLRGDILQPSVIIGRRFPEFFTRANSKLTTLNKSPTKLFTAQGSGRLQLAEWLTQADSIQAALVARTAVNRVWQHLFGEGLCRTPKELGRLGHVPVLPELIDGLAVRFIARRWSLKSLVREIVLSKAYRRSSIGSDTQFKADPQNVCVSRQAVKRLESEPIMNTMAYLRHGKRFVGPEARNSNLLGFDEFFRNYDGPTTDDLIDRRVASISATQALFMMNNGSVSKVIAAGLSKRIRGTDNLDLPSILQPIYLTVLQRHPSERESKIAAAFVARRRKQTGQVDHVAEIREFIHLLLCGNELIYIE